MTSVTQLTPEAFVPSGDLLKRTATCLRLRALHCLTKWPRCERAETFVAYIISKVPRAMCVRIIMRYESAVLRVLCIRV